MEFDEDLLLRTFVAEAEDLLLEMEEALLALEANPRDRETLRAVFRCAHTLKGNASCVGLDEFSAVTHRLEDYLDRVKTGSAVITAGTVTGLLSLTDLLRESVSRAATGQHFVPPQAEAILEGLTGGTDSAGAFQEGAGTDARGAARSRSIRVDTSKLDRVLDLTGEISIARGRFKRLLDVGGSIADLGESYGDVERLSTELQELLMKLRMVPVGPFFRQYTRTVRDTAATHGKVARLVLEGEDVEVDLAVIEHLRNPLTHMIRNAVDHGIEMPAVRVAAGKPEEGRITLAAFRDAGTIVIRVSDDGAGIDRGRIAERARRMGMDPEKFSDPELLRLILLPGFTTASEVTEISGRGMGMDVVRRNIEELHGSVSVESSTGTTIVIRLPLTLAIIDGFVVGAGNEYYILPLDSIAECLDHPAKDSDKVFGVANVRGEPVSYVRLRRFLGLGGEVDGSENAVIVSSGGCRAGLVVDRLEGEQQVVVKPLAKLFQRIGGLAGSAVLGNGRVALVLDVPMLLEKCIAASRERADVIDAAMADRPSAHGTSRF